jgi:hypothetical protein
MKPILSITPFAKAWLPVYFLLITFNVSAQQAAVRSEPWNAFWIAAPPLTAMPRDPAMRDVVVLRFRKQIRLDTLPVSFPVYVSADNRYQLFVNEQLVSMGPARGDLYHWNYETVDLAPYLHKGINILAAVVWNFGDLRPEAQISWRTGFILQGYSKKEERLNTDASWKVTRDSSYRLLRNRVPGYYVAGPGELVDMQYAIRGWTGASYADEHWSRAQIVSSGQTRESAIDYTGWMLVPSSLPQMEMKKEQPLSLRRTEGMDQPVSFPGQALTIPAHKTVRLLLDQGYLTNAYPTIFFSGGKHARISIGYAESLYIPDTTRNLDTTKNAYARFRIVGKGNRNEVEGKKFIGTKDSLISDGSRQQQYSPLWWRTYRYVLLTIQTEEEALVLDDISGTFTGYPFQQRASFESSDTTWKQLLDIGWRTARLCAFETYMDCPFYEQLQYIGDTRIQALVSLYESGDDRLMRQALDQLDHSRIAEGITLSRWPSFTQQQIPPFSLWYIGMLHDYFLYRDDSALIQEKLPGVRQILSWFERYQQKDGSLKNLPFWNFTDWLTAKGWARGMAPVGKKGESAMLDLQLLWALQQAAEMESRLGISGMAQYYSRKAAQLMSTIQKKYWSNTRGLFADTEEKDLFSQHSNSLALLTGVVKGKPARLLAEKIISDSTLVKASLYFKYYVHQALAKGGLGNHYPEWLGTWQENIRLGLSTWAEMSDVSASRSDCHAWGASPNIEVFRTILGVDTDAPGFGMVLIEPHLGNLSWARGTMPHPQGNLSVSYEKTDGAWNVAISLPGKLTGRLIWKGKIVELKSGRNVFHLR